jgi:hypothetical protein
VSWDSLVINVTGWVTGIQFPASILPSCYCIQTSSDAHSYPNGIRDSFSRNKADHLSTSGGQVMNEWRFNSNAMIDNLMFISAILK